MKEMRGMKNLATDNAFTIEGAITKLSIDKNITQTE